MPELTCDLPLFPAPAFGRRKVVPRVHVVDAKRHIRAFLCDVFEELGFIAQDCATCDELVATLANAPDLIVIGLSAHPPENMEMLDALALHRFAGRILLIGARGALALTALCERGATLGLTMLPPLAAPYSDDDLRNRVGKLLPHEPPPSPPVDVAEALHLGWLELWYQAQIDARTLTLGGAEALIRMRHPTWGIVPPAEFIPRDEAHLHALSDFVLARAVADWTYFVTEYRAIDVAINLPLAALAHPAAIDDLRAKLPVHPAFKGLTIEVDGTELMRNLPTVTRIARALRFYNVGISIDLDGEWSSLAGLDDFPFVELKVDRQFVSGCAEDRLKRAVCQTVLDIAERYGARTVAEGVETRADFAAVRDMGFHLVQGFLFSKPMTAAKFARSCLTRPVKMA
jgi:EAL domain-containing protein (putative c-di-GMP-specific phosphodiesterase class I)